jgi:hypothetical protein
MKSSLSHSYIMVDMNTIVNCSHFATMKEASLPHVGRAQTQLEPSSGFSNFSELINFPSLRKFHFSFLSFTAKAQFFYACKKELWLYYMILLKIYFQ